MSDAPTGSSEAEAPSRLGRGLAVGVVLGILVYAALLLVGDAGGITDALRDLDPRVPLVVCCLSFANYAVRFPRWQRYLRIVGVELPRRTSFQIYLAGLSLTVSPGKMGETLKSWLVRDVAGTRVARTAPIVVAERVTDLLGFLVLVAIGGRALGYGWLAAAALGASTVLIALLVWPSAERAAVHVVERISPIASLAPRLAIAAESTRALLSPRELVPATLLATVGWSLEGVGCWIVVDALAPGAVEPLEAVGAFATAAVGGALAIVLPGGLGVTEGLLGTLLERPLSASGLAADAAHTAALSATLVVRLCTLWFAMGLGLVALAVFRRARSRCLSRPS